MNRMNQIAALTATLSCHPREQLLEDDVIQIELSRDPRSGLERIDFRILADMV